MADCFEYIIGLSDRDCECNEGGRPEDYNESLSGLFISQLLPEEELESLAGCDRTFWDSLAEARFLAVRKVQEVFNANVLKKSRLLYPTYSGYLGKTNGSEKLVSTKDYAGLRIQTNGLKSGYINIKSVVANFEATGTVTAAIYQKIGDEAVQVGDDITLNTVANRPTETAVNRRLPLMDTYGGRAEYFLAYIYDEDFRPILSEVICGPCSGKFYPETNFTNWHPGGYTNPHGMWHNYLAVGGFTADSIAGDITIIDASELGTMVSRETNGLSLQIELGCDLIAGLCGLVNNFDSNPVAMSVATAVHLMSGVILVEKRVNSSLPNRGNITNKEGYKKLAAGWEDEFFGVMKFLTDSVSPEANDCLGCKPYSTIKPLLG